MASTFKIALVQLKVGADKDENLARARQKLGEAAGNGATLIALPECFNSPYGTSYFPKYAETVPGGPSYDMLSRAARELKTFIIGGSIPEQEGDSYYNTCLVFDPEGNLVAKHRKVHLFDIDVPGKIRFQESEILKPGNSITQFQTPFAKIGVGICYDIRFPELAMICARDGCDVMVYPGAFNMTTGPVHWELLQRARALDNQIYVAAVSPARDTAASYIAWGHSTVVNPWGEVIAKTEHDESIIYADIDLAKAAEIRRNIPVGFQRRSDLYSLAKVSTQ